MLLNKRNYALGIVSEFLGFGGSIKKHWEFFVILPSCDYMLFSTVVSDWKGQEVVGKLLARFNSLIYSRVKIIHISH